MAKTAPKLGAFISKNADDAPKVVEAISQVSKQISNGDDALVSLAKSLDPETIAKIEESVKSAKNITKADYSKSLNILEAAGKNVDSGKSILSTLNSVDARRVIDLTEHFNDISSIDDLYSKLKSLPINYEDIGSISSEVEAKLNSLISDAVNAGNTQALRKPDLWLKFATHNDSSDVVVLGKYIENKDPWSYEQIAQAKGHSYFELCCYDDLRKALGNDYDFMWEINRKYLDNQIAKGKDFLINRNPFDESALKFESNGIVGLTGFGKEMDYLKSKGYTLTDTPDINGFYHAKK